MGTNTITGRIKNLMDIQGITTSMLSEQTGISKYTITDYRKESRCNPSVYNVRKLAKALNSTPGYILNGKIRKGISSNGIVEPKKKKSVSKKLEAPAIEVQISNGDRDNNRASKHRDSKTVYIIKGIFPSQEYIRYLKTQIATLENMQTVNPHYTDLQKESLNA